MRPATPDDRAWVEDRLAATTVTAMFPRANLRSHGWGSNAPRAMRFWLDRDTGALLGVTNEGMLMPVTLGRGFAGAASPLAGLPVLGALGDAAVVRPLLAALGLERAPAKLDEDEPQFLLDLADLPAPRPGDRLAPLSDDPARARAWRRAYVVETLGEDPDLAAAQAETDIDNAITAGSHRFLIRDGAPVAMTGINARLPEIVQIGGVFTPPDLRCRGHARAAVALHLADARAAGVRQATLFASGPAAIRAYQAIGFREIGTYSLVLFRDGTRIPGGARP